jgi:hypothetical protein
MNRTMLIGAAVAALVVAGVIWVVFSRGSVQAGVGPYAAELDECQEAIWENLMHPDDLEYAESRVWHQVDGDELHIGGVLSLLNDAGQRLGHEYSCLIRGERIILADIE